MRIIIDLQSCQAGSRLGGIGRYSIELAKAMARNAGGHDFWLMLNNLLPNAEAEIRHAFSDLIPQDRIRIFSVPNGIAELSNNKTKVRVAELVREEFLQLLKADIVHVSSLFEGLQEQIVTSVGNFYPGEKTAVTLYDLIPLVQRARYLANNDALNHYLGKVESLKKSGLLLAISDFSRTEAINLLDIDPERVVNISSAADERFRPVDIPVDEAMKLKKRYGIDQKFLMYTGSFDQRKNHANLIRAFGLLPYSVRRNYQLLIVGNGWDGIYQQLGAVAKESGLSKNEVIFAGHVADSDLLPLYNLCDLFVFPSFAEGFGLPVLEAMSCGTPTICSNCTSLPEVIGLPEAQFDPNRPDSIASTMQRALAEKGFSEMLSAHGLKQARNFSWDASARKAIAAFEEQHRRLNKTKAIAVESPSSLSEKSLPARINPYAIEHVAALDGIGALPEELLREVSACMGLNRYQAEVISAISLGQVDNLNVGWVTTWNTRCGVAAYSKFLYDSFPAKQTIFAPEALQTVEPDQSNVKRCWKAGGEDDLSGLFAEIKQANIEVLFIQFNYGFFDFASLARLLQKLVGLDIRVFVTFHSTHDPSNNKRLSSISGALSVCNGLLVHTIRDVNVLRELGLSHNTMFVPQGVVDTLPAVTPNSHIASSRVIATYGFALPSKGLAEMVEAFALLAQDKSQRFHLLMVNAEYPDPRSAELISAIRARVHELGIESQVTLITDYLSDELSLGYLQHADLIVYGYQNTGESSSAAVRMGIAARQPVAVTPLGIFDDVASVVFKLPGIQPSEIAAGIAQILTQLDKSDSAAIALARNSELWISAHSYAAIARHLYWAAARPEIGKYSYQLPPSFSITPSSGKVVFRAFEPPMQTQAGTITSNGVATSSRAGVLLFGPFISIAPGTYSAVIRGTVKNSVNWPSNRVDIVIEGGGKILAESPIASSTESDVVSQLTFEIPAAGGHDMEVRVFADDAAEFEISCIEISPFI